MAEATINGVPFTEQQKQDFADSLGLVRGIQNPLTGRIEILGPSGAKILESSMAANGVSMRERLALMLSAGRKLRIHMYGNSFFAASSNVVRSMADASGGRLSVVKNSGVGGLTSAQVLTKLQTDGIDSRADIVVFQEGTNDAAGGVTVKAHIENMLSIAQYVRAAGRVPIMVCSPPTDNAYAALVNSYARAEKIFADANDIPCYDPWEKLRDTDGTWVSGASSDSLHPTLVASNTAGVEFYGQIANGHTLRLLPASNSGNGLFATNELLLTDTNTDGLPNDWTATGMTGATYALSPETYPARGNKCVVTFSQSAGGGIYRGFSTGFSVGDVLKFTGFVGLVSATNARIAAYIRFVGPDLYEWIYASTQVEQGRYIDTDIVVPAGSTSVQVYFRIEPIVSGAFSGVAEFSGFNAYNVTSQLAI